MDKPTIAWMILAGLAMAMPLRADVHARLSQSSVGQNEPVTLTLESNGAAAAPPDLSPLEQDFHIVNRSSSHSMRSFNGRRTQRTAITLTLIPKRGGELTIPAIDFGQEHTQPLRLSVTPSADTGFDSGYPDNQGSGPMEPAPFPFPLPQQGFPQGFGAAPPFSAPQDWGGMQETPGMPGMQDMAFSNAFPGWNSGGFGMPAWTGQPEAKGWEAQQDEAPSAAKPEKEEATYWPWITGLLLAGWLITTVLLGLKTRRIPKAVAAPEPAHAAPVQDRRPQAAEALEEVHRAYEKADALAAKAALLRWAAIQWPANPPTNLSRLAAHCPPTVQRRILKLDESLYSPKPIPWNQESVWEQLADIGQDEPLAHSNP